MHLYVSGTIITELQWKKTPSIMMWCILKKEQPGSMKQEKKK